MIHTDKRFTVADRSEGKMFLETEGGKMKKKNAREDSVREFQEMKVQWAYQTWA